MLRGVGWRVLFMYSVHLPVLVMFSLTFSLRALVSVFLLRWEYLLGFWTSPSVCTVEL